MLFIAIKEEPISYICQQVHELSLFIRRQRKNTASGPHVEHVEKPRIQQSKDKDLNMFSWQRLTNFDFLEEKEKRNDIKLTTKRFTLRM